MRGEPLCPFLVLEERVQLLPNGGSSPATGHGYCSAALMDSVIAGDADETTTTCSDGTQTREPCIFPRLLFSIHGWLEVKAQRKSCVQRLLQQVVGRSSAQAEPGLTFGDRCQQPKMSTTRFEHCWSIHREPWSYMSLGVAVCMGLLLKPRACCQVQRVLAPEILLCSGVCPSCRPHVSLRNAML